MPTTRVGAGGLMAAMNINQWKQGLSDAHMRQRMRGRQVGWGPKPPGRGTVGGGRGTLADQVSQKFNEANEANEQRYQDILSGYLDIIGGLGRRQDTGVGERLDTLERIGGRYQDRYNTGMGILANLGDQERRDIDRLVREQEGVALNDLVSRGLRDSSLAANVRQGFAERKGDLYGRLFERLKREQFGAHSQLSGDELGYLERGAGDVNAARDRLSGDVFSGMQNRLNFMERRNDIGPNAGLFAQLAQMYGESRPASGTNFAGVPIYQDPQALGYRMPRFGQIGFGRPMMGGRPQMDNRGALFMNMLRMMQQGQRGGQPAAAPQRARIGPPGVRDAVTGAVSPFLPPGVGAAVGGALAGRANQNANASAVSRIMQDRVARLREREDRVNRDLHSLPPVDQSFIDDTLSAYHLPDTKEYFPKMTNVNAPLYFGPPPRRTTMRAGAPGGTKGYARYGALGAK